MRGRTIRWTGWAPAVVAVAFLAAFGAARASAAGPGDYLKYAPDTHEAFVYLDVAQIRNSKMYNNLKTDLMAGNVQMALAGVEQMTGVRIPDDIDAVAGSLKIAQDAQGVVLIRARVDRQRVEAMFAMNPGYSETIKPGGKMIGFLDEGKGTMTYFSFLQNDLVVIGKKEGVENALSIVAGEGTSLVNKPGIKTQLANAGTSPVLMVIAQMPEQLPPDMLKVPQIQNVNSLLLTLVPGPDMLTLIAQLKVETQELTGQLLDIARGLIAVGEIQEQVPQIAELARQMTADKQEGNIVRIQAKIDTIKAQNFIRQHLERQRANQANVGGRRIQRAPATGKEKPIPPQW